VARGQVRWVEDTGTSARIAALKEKNRKNTMDREITPEEFETHKNPAELSQAMISADYTTSKVMGKKEAFWYLDCNRLDYTRGEKTKEELTIFLNNGGEGIDLTFDETCLIYGIAYIFTKYEYPPYIECTEKQLYEALKYEKKFGGWQRRKLGRMLEDLSLKKFPLYWKEERRRWITFDSLIRLAWGIRIDESNVEFQELPSRENFELYRIWLNERLFGRVNKNFRLVNPNIGREIREYRRMRDERPSKYDIRLYDFLLNENRRIIKRNYLKIAQAPMLMDGLIRKRRKGWIRTRLNDIYEMYYNLGYLKDFKIDQAGTRYEVDVLYLNPQKFYLLRDLTVKK
jgi:hypothetical protein